MKEFPASDLADPDDFAGGHAAYAPNAEAPAIFYTGPNITSTYLDRRRSGRLRRAGRAGPSREVPGGGRLQDGSAEVVTTDRRKLKIDTSG